MEKEPTLKELTDIDSLARNISKLSGSEQDIIIATCNGLVEGVKLSALMKEAKDGV